MRYLCEFFFLISITRCKALETSLCSLSRSFSKEVYKSHRFLFYGKKDKVKTLQYEHNNCKVNEITNKLRR